MGSCTCNRPFQRNYQTTISINYGPFYSKSDFNNLNNNNNLDDKFKSNLYLSEKNYIVPMFNDQKNLINGAINSDKNTNININSKKLQKKLENLKAKNNLFNDNIKEQENFINNQKLYIKQLYDENINSYDNLRIYFK